MVSFFFCLHTKKKEIFLFCRSNEPFGSVVQNLYRKVFGLKNGLNTKSILIDYEFYLRNLQWNEWNLLFVVRVEFWMRDLLIFDPIFNIKKNQSEWFMNEIYFLWNFFFFEKFKLNIEFLRRGTNLIAF